MQRNKQLWLSQTKQGRDRYYELKEEYFSVTKLIQHGQDPLAQMVAKSISAAGSSYDTPIQIDPHKAKQDDLAVTSLIKKDVVRTLPEHAAF